MTYKVIVTKKAKQQLDASYVWFAKRNSEHAARWYNGLIDRLESLSKNPERYAIAHETRDLPIKLHELLYGTGRTKTHRVLFAIRPKTVVVHAIRHCSQVDISADEL